ncbi:MAG TPA: hypothetical protein VFL86_09245 [Burkholderiaceae bacterium]|nr:hypothetical protein [Burkholderiaceae bacterium]
MNLITACGGGASSEAEADVTPGLVQITGIATSHDAQHSVRTAPGGTVVKLVSLGSGGEAIATLAETTTDDQGRYKLAAPQGTRPGAELALQVSEPDATTYRALVLEAQVDVGPASEAFARELLAAPVSWKNLPASDAERMLRFQRAVAQFLGTSEPHRSTPEVLVLELRARLRADPASNAVLTALQAGAGIPNLGDIGALFGLGRAAWMAEDSDGTLREWITQPSSTTPGDYDLIAVYRSQTEWPPRRSVRATFRAERDGITTITPDLGINPAQSAVILNQMLGPLRTFEVGLSPGKAVRINDIHRSTGSYTFDADQSPDTLHYTTDLTVLGPERLQHFGGSVLALKVSSVNQLQVDLSSGGSIRVTETRIDWHVPFAGIVRSDSSVTGVDRNGNATTGVGSHALRNGVTNRVSWPGGVRIEATRLAWDTEDSRQGYPLGLTPQRNLVLHAEETFGIRPVVAVFSIDDGRLIASKSFDLPVGRVGDVRLSPDGTKLYGVTARTSDFTDIAQAYPADQAASAGAVFMRFDANTLSEEARLTLPAEPSKAFPHLAFPRSALLDYMLSPIDTSQLLVASLGTVLYAPDGTATSYQFSPPWEAYGPNQPIPRLFTDRIMPLAWDDLANEVWLRVTPLFKGSTVYAVPVQGQVLQLDKARPVPPFVDEAGQPMNYPTPPGNTRFTEDAVFVNDFRYKFSKADGRLLGRNKSTRGEGLEEGTRNRCQHQQERVVCVVGNGLTYESFLVFLRSADLSETLKVDLQRRMRSDAGQSIDVDLGDLYQLSRDEFAFMKSVTPGFEASVLRIILN